MDATLTLTEYCDFGIDNTEGYLHTVQFVDQLQEDPGASYSSNFSHAQAECNFCLRLPRNKPTLALSSRFALPDSAISIMITPFN